MSNYKQKDLLRFQNKNLAIISCDIDQFFYVTTVDLYCRNIKILPAELFSLQKIRKLEIIGQIKVLPAKISNLQCLEILCLRGNQLKNLPRELFSLQNIHDLDISSNYIKFLPKKILNLKLKTIKINFNKFPDTRFLLSPSERLEYLDCMGYII